MTCRDKTIIKAEQAPLPIGPYSAATAGGPFVFTAGQLGIDPKTAIHAMRMWSKLPFS